MHVYFKLIPELWSIIGNMLHAKIEQTDDSIEIKSFPSTFYTIEFTDDQTFVFPGCEIQ